jgi:hypothetical protein
MRGIILIGIAMTVMLAGIVAWTWHKADIQLSAGNVRFVPKADIVAYHLVGSSQSGRSMAWCLRPEVRGPRTSALSL